MGKDVWLCVLGALVCWLSTLCILQHRTIATQQESLDLLYEKVTLLELNNDLCSVTLEKQAHMNAKTKRVAETCLATFDETFSGLGLSNTPRIQLASKSLLRKEGGIGPVGVSANRRTIQPQNPKQQ